jgi:hypothetical protein
MSSISSFSSSWILLSSSRVCFLNRSISSFSRAA